MSGSAIKWGRSQRKYIPYSQATKSVFIELCTFADDKNEASFNIKWIATELGCAESTVKQSLRDLEGLGLISRSQRGNQYRSSLWNLHLDVSLEFGLTLGKHLVLVQDSDEQTENVSPENGHAKKVKVRNTSSVSPKKASVSPKNNPLNILNSSSNIKRKHPKWVLNLLEIDFAKRKDLNNRWMVLMEKIYSADLLELESMNFINWVSQPKYKGKYSNVARCFANHLKDKNPKKNNGSFNASKGGNMNEILKMSKKFNKEIS